MAELSQHRLRENLGGVVFLLTIDASSITGNPAHIRRFTNQYGENGGGIIYQGNTFEPYPYELKSVNRSAKSNKSGAKIRLSNIDDVYFTRFIEDVGGSIEGARVYELKAYERYLDNGVEPNIQAYSKRLDHEINYIEESDRVGELILHTVDPLSKDVQVPSIQFSAGIPNDPASSINVFPAVDRDMAQGR